MSFRLRFRPIILSLLILPTIPLLALLCRGHTPSRLTTVNLPVWEQRPPRALAPCQFFRLPPLPPGAVILPSSPLPASLVQADENRLMRGAEHPGRGDAGLAGSWLEAACAWGRSRPDLSAKQDRIAVRLMMAQDENGLFGARSIPAALGEGPASPAPLTPQDIKAQTACLRGLLAFYGLTRRPAAIYAAMLAGNRVITEPEMPETGRLSLPLTRLYQETGEARYLTFARRQAANDKDNALEECALYEATGQPDCLQAARQQWAKNHIAPALTTELLLLTGEPQYAAALDRLPKTQVASSLSRVAWTCAPLGMAVNTTRDADAALSNLHLRQRTRAGSRTITVQVPHPTAFALRVFLPPGPSAQIDVNGAPQSSASPGRYAVLVRRWRNGDVVTVH